MLSAHSLLPLVACLLNTCLAGVSLFRNGGSRLNRVFVYLTAGLAVWNFGVFMLRTATDEPAAHTWEIVIHVGLIMVPALYYHFVLIFLDTTTRHRRSLALAYGLGLVFLALDLTDSPLFMRGVTRTHWGWAPGAGPLYTVFLGYFYAFLVAGLCRLVRGLRAAESSFRRIRTLLLIAGTALSLTGGAVDFVRFILARVFPALDQVYPVGIPANMLFALLIGTAIVRYRLFDVSVVAKRAAIYVLLTGLFGAALGLGGWLLGGIVELEAMSGVGLAAGGAVIMTLLIGPVGQAVQRVIERAIFSQRRGAYETLLALSKRMGTLLDSRTLMDVLVEGLVRGIRLTHAALLVREPASGRFVVTRAETAIPPGAGAVALDGGSRVVAWLERADGVLVKEEIRLDPELADHFDGAEAELEAVNAALIVPLRTEDGLAAILLLGEKVSGGIFDGAELEVLSVLASQAGIALENARLYGELATSNVRLTQANRLKSQFLAGMSHELRTPLNSIIGYSKVLLKGLGGRLSGQQETCVRSVYDSSTHLLQLINSVLDISRIEAGRAELRLEEVDVAALVQQCVETSASLAQGKPLRIASELPADLPPLTADRTKLSQILLNLLSNAVKFTPAGLVVVRAEANAREVRFDVSDTGVGIRKQDLPRLFRPFERLERLAQDVGGTGLGLALSKRLVDLHGGRIWVESRENVGSTFHFTVPRVRAGEALVA